MSLPTLNVELLDRTVEFMDRYPEQHYQRAWRCGAGMCIAAIAAELAGGVWVEDATHWMASHLKAEAEDDESLLGFLGYGPIVSAKQRAIRVLGLTDYEAHELFRASNSRDTIRYLVKMIKRGALR